MKKTLVLVTILFILSGLAFGQVSSSATYSLGDIEADPYFLGVGQSSSCPGTLVVNIPVGAVITGVDVSYDFEALAPYFTSEQRSQLWCVSTGGTKESSVATNMNWGSGVWSYSRTGLTIADGVSGGGAIEFELHAGIDNLEPFECGVDFHKVNNETWTVTVHYMDPGAPLSASNPAPADSAVDVLIVPGQLTWDFGDNTDSYDLYFGTENPPATLVAEDVATGGSGSGSYDYGTLTGSSIYYWRVISKNSAPAETAGPVWRFTTECLAQSVPVSENFDSYTFPQWNGPEGYHGLTPLCWSTLHECSVATANNGFYSQPFSFYSAPNVWMASNSGDGEAWAMMITPQLADDISTLQLTFFAKSISGDIIIHIGTVSDPEDGSSFSEFTSVSTGSDFSEFEIPFLGYAGTDEYIAIKYEASAPSTYQYLFVDNVTIDVAPSCSKPKDLFASNVGAGSAQLNWLEQGSATQWNIEFGLSGFSPGGIPDITTTENPYLLEGLDLNTAYDFYVQSDCGSGDLSIWSGPVTFETTCENMPLPIFENFNASMSLPDCWSVAATSGTWWQISSVNFYSAPYCFLFYFNTAQDNIALVSPGTEAGSLSELMISFYAHHSWQNGHEVVVGTMSDPTDISTFTPFETIVTTSVMTEYEVLFNTYAGTDQYIAITPGPDEIFEYMYIDDITIDYVPGCLTPVDVYVDEISLNEATIHWTEGGTATKWEIELGIPGFEPGIGAYLQQYVFDPGSPPADYSYVMDGLESGTHYEAFIRAYCSDSDISDWSDPVLFLSDLEYFMTLPLMEDFESGFDITGNIPTNTVQWTIDDELFNGGTQSAHNAYGYTNNNVLLVYGKLNLAIYPKSFLSFAHIAKVEGEGDECYVEISTDGGITFDQFPISSYYGTGNYSVPESGLAEGPCFTEDSYPDWGVGNEVPTDTWWRNETFDLSSWAGETNVVIRFRLSSNAYTNRAGWYIDDILFDTYHGMEAGFAPESIEVTLSKGSSATEQLTIENLDDFPIAYTATVVNTAGELTVIHEEDFNEFPADWTIIDGGDSDTTWYWYNPDEYTYPNNLDGTPYMYVQRLYPDVASEQMISPVIDASGYATTYVEFDHHWGYGSNTDFFTVSVWDGSAWIVLYEYDKESYTNIGGWDNPVHEKINVTAYAGTEFQVEFYYSATSWSRWAIDNFSVTGSYEPLEWLTLNGGLTASGLVMEGESNVIDVGFIASEYAPYGTWITNIEIASNDSAFPIFIVPCTMNIAGASIGTSPSAVQFDDTYIASSSMKTLVITNTGTEDLEISDITFSDPTFFSYLSTPIVLEPGETQDMVVQFAPFELGLIEGTIQFSSNDAGNPEHVVNLTGESIDDAINGWEYHYTGFNFILMDIAFPEGQNQVGYSVGQSSTYNGDGVVIKTTDSGETWVQMNSGTIPGLQGCSFVSMETGYAVGWDGYVIKTTDGGQTWDEITVAGDIYELSDVEFFDEDKGIVIGGIQAWVTSDGGETWTESVGIEHVIYQVTYADESTLFAVGGDNYIYKSIDGGLNWTDVNSGFVGQFLLGVDFLNAEFGIAVGDYGEVLQTNDGGATWDVQSIGDNLFHGVHIWNEDTIHIVGTPDLIFKTTDGGSNWESQYPAYSAWKAYYKVLFTENYTGFICGGSNGIVLRKEATDLPVIAVDPLIIEYDTTLVGEYSEAIITITNNGTADLDVSGFEFSNPAFSSDINSLLLGPGLSEEVVITFTPENTGWYEATLFIESNDNVTGTVAVDLSGYGNTITGITSADAQKIGFYPNPASDFLYLYNITNCEIYLYSLAGELKIQERATELNSTRLSLHEMQSGSYLIKIVAESGETVVEKLEIIR